MNQFKLPQKYFLPLDLKRFSFVQRERGKKNRCLRDAIFYTLHYYYPQIFHKELINPKRMEDIRLLGFKIPDSSPIFGGAQYTGIPRLLDSFDITVELNGRQINNRISFWKNFILRSIPYSQMLELLKAYLKKGIACSLDLPIKGLLEHVIFVYGIDKEYIYFIDTHQVEGIPYKRLSKKRGEYLMKMSLKDLEKVWDYRGLLWAFKLGKV